MLIERLANGWSIQVPAKLNLFLEVLRRRPDGYHDLDTVMMGVGLCDRLELEPTLGSELRLEVLPLGETSFEKLSSDDPAWDVPATSHNLVVKALDKLRAHLSISRGISVRLFKGIPSQAGLGGGSADAAAAIVGGMLCWNQHVDFDQASSIAGSLGSDLNFFLEGKSAISSGNNWAARCTGRGEMVEPIQSRKRIHFVILHPPAGCSTQRIFSQLASQARGLPEKRDVQPVIECIRSETTQVFRGLIFNRLESAAKLENAWIEKLMNRMNECDDFDGFSMTGSGSAVFGVAKNEESAQEQAKKLGRELKVRSYAISSWQAPTIVEQLEVFGCR